MIAHNLTDAEIAACARDECLDEAVLRERLTSGIIICLRNRNHAVKPVLAGAGTRTKINANIGTSGYSSSLDDEICKLTVAVAYGADMVMDLSTGGDLAAIRRELLAKSPVPLGTVPVYEVAVRAAEKKMDFMKVPPEMFLEVVEEQAEQGVDFMTIHCGVTASTVEELDKVSRLTGVVSRGGSMHANWIRINHKENPYTEHFDRICDLAVKYNFTLSLGDGLRPGSTADATDAAQVAELNKLGELTEFAWERGASVMIEGPGHVPLDQIQMNMELEKRICRGAPFYVLGPLVIDFGAGYDHITAAIGGAVAAQYGADILCYVTPAEHLGLPNLEEVREGVIAFKIAAYAADLAKHRPEAVQRNYEMSHARKWFDWEKQIALSIAPEKARAIRTRDNLDLSMTGCSMCGDFCSMKENAAQRKAAKAAAKAAGDNGASG